MNKITLAIDVMGGDGGPETTIEGVSLATKLYPDVKFKLFGDKKKSENSISKFNLEKNIEFVHTTEFIKSKHRQSEEIVTMIEEMFKLNE